jgi:molybdopterin synthase catalytic subunit
MQIDVQLTRAPIEPWPPPAAGPAVSGAVVEFTGVVRGMENAAPIAALEYEAYDSMALSEMRRLLQELSAQFPCHAVRVIHRVGIVPAGEAAICVRVEAAHRQEAFGLMTTFLDALKRDVPIWKNRALKELPSAS